MNAESIWNKPLIEHQKAALEGIAKRQKRADVCQIDYSGIPALTDKQLTQFRRPWTASTLATGAIAKH